MGIRHALLAAATFFSAATPAPAEPSPTAGHTAIAVPVRRLAESLIASYAGKDQPGDLDTLFRLQLATHQYSDAQATLAKLTLLYRNGQAGRAYALVPWRIYARAKERETEGGSFEQAFSEFYGSLADKEAVEVLPWYGANLDRGRRTLAEAEKACAGSTIQACPAGLDLVKAYQFQATWDSLLPRSAPLMRADAERRFIIDDDVLVPTPDGARIAAMIVRPRSAAPVSALMSFTIYARDDWSFADAAKMAAYGYAGVVAYTRGKGRSPGPAVPYVHDGADAATVIDWLAKQSWSDGRVGMFSGSYNASAQWAALKHMPKALKAIATNASNAPGIDTPMERNIFLNFIYPWPLYTTTLKGLDDGTYFDLKRWSALNSNWYVSGKPYRVLPQIDGHANPIFAEWLNHPDYDSYWQRLIPYKEEFARIKIPVFVATGYFDGGMVGALYYLRQHYRYNPAADHRLLIGPYHHTAMQTGVLANINGYDVDVAARLDLQDIRLKWFDHVFRGAPLPEILSDRINFEVMGANLWRHVPTLDAMGNGKLRLYLNDARDGDRFTLSENRPTARGHTDLEVDFADRSDVGYQPPADIFSRDLDTRNALVFATAPMSEQLEVNGAFSGRFNIVTNKKDLDLSVSLYEQLPDGGYFPLTTFIGRASYLHDRSRRRLIHPGTTETLSFESDRITARRIAAGSRIVAVVGVIKQPDMQINYGAGKDVSDESIADAGKKMRVRWESDSFIELRVQR